ncbi:MAG: methyltransferase domain-containing protein, partial [Chloroflexaceae bacterium]|nr:methyltransferase domain-containing protein [Chloroflexaceae bacterium]
PFTTLDVATGSADLPLAMQQAASRAGLRLRAYGSDLRPDVLAEAQRYSGGSVSLLCHDALHLPFANGAFDVVTCSQTLHHFGEAEALLVLRELQRVARQAVVMSDLHRSWEVYWGARLLALALRSPMSRHDGPLSARRAYTAAEVRQLLGKAGLRGRVRRAGLAHWVAIIPGQVAPWPPE